MCTESFKFTGNEVAGYYTLCLTVNYYKIQHFVAGIALYGTCSYLFVKRCVSTKEELLSGLSAGIEGTAYLYTTE